MEKQLKRSGKIYSIIVIKFVVIILFGLSLLSILFGGWLLMSGDKMGVSYLVSGSIGSVLLRCLFK